MVFMKRVGLDNGIQISKLGSLLLAMIPGGGLFILSMN